MKVRSVRIPEEIDRAIDYVARSEKLEKTSSLRKLNYPRLEGEGFSDKRRLNST